MILIISLVTSALSLLLISSKFMTSTLDLRSLSPEFYESLLLMQVKTRQATRIKTPISRIEKTAVRASLAEFEIP
jgi:hypothetical protein